MSLSSRSEPSAEPAGPFLVTGASGNVGSAVAASLLRCGLQVRFGMHRLVHTEQSTQNQQQVRLDFADPGTYAAALKGMKGVFLMRPNPVIAVKKTVNRFLDVAADQGVMHCVFLSVAGADRNRMVPHYAIEQHLMRGPMHWTMLRAAFFAQNLTGPYREDIRSGVMVLPAGQGKVAYVDARDLGEVASMALREPGRHAGCAYHLTGADSLSFHEVAALLSSILARPVKYEAASLWRFWRHCRSRAIGIVPTFAYAVIHASLRGGGGASIDPMLAKLLGRPARTLRGFIEEHRSVWN
ncbi:MAG TPA: NmrA family NAD(P)-binding protein [Steroidobacteraceae bacterium]